MDITLPPHDALHNKICSCYEKRNFPLLGEGGGLHLKVGWTVHQGDYITPVCDVGCLLAQFSSIFRKPLVGTSAAAASLATKLMRSVSLSWFVVHGKINGERSIGNVLAASGFEVFLPVAALDGNGQTEPKNVQPLFPSYIFARFDICERRAFLKALGVISIIGRGKHPVPLTDDEVATFE